ncbi:MAG TPA: Ig-like domain-containing protein, partial [Vicinamibacterales bacterium]|nr:Ig-like domain-containing protein [Vicinamibacterales bacterium]
GAEQSDNLTRFDHYNYWANMRADGGGTYWGNTLLNNASVRATPGQWMCVEHMVKLNNPVSSFNGEHAIWLNGVKVSHLGQGFPNGYWSGGNFTQDPAGSPFEGFRWRSDANLNLNWIWLQVYAPGGGSGNIKYAHVVAAKSYVGCLSPASGPSPGDTTPPSVSITSPAAGATVSGSSVTVSANASDNVGVAGVQFKLDGVNLGSEDTTAPYSISWNTTATANGSHALTVVARDAAGNQATSPSMNVTVNNGTGSGGGSALFSSSWDTAVGTAASAVTDGGRWPNYWEFNGGSGVQLLSVVSGGPNGHNALRVQQRGSSFAANVQVDNIVPPGTDYYVRFYMRNDDTSNSGDHIVTVDTWNYSNLTYLRKYGGPVSYNWVLSMYGCGYTYPIGHWGPAVPLLNGRWYRFEYYIHYTDATHVQVHPRVYDDTGVLILSDANFLQSDFGGAAWNGRSDWTLASYYAAGHSFCVDPGWMRMFGLGNNGQFGAADTGLYWYFGGVEIRTDRWPGPVQ